MKKSYILIIIVVILIGGLIAYFQLASPSISIQPSGTTTILAKDLNLPWAMDLLPNGTIIFTERVGKVKLLGNNGTVVTVGNINVTEAVGIEPGLLGIAVDPNFTQNHYIYLYYTYGVYTNRISRFVLNGNLTDEKVLLDNIPGGAFHNGGRLKFGPDSKLYATTGDTENSSSAQDKNSLGGKILRLNPDGTVPSDNPFGNYVYSYGHRDPQGITWSSNGTLYESEHGNIMNDEINIIEKGGNYGWPIVEGNESAPGLISPIIVYNNFTLAPSGIAYSNNHLYVAGLRGTQLRVLNLSNDGKTITGEYELFTNIGRVRDVVEHNGYLYICTSNLDGRGIPQPGDDKIIQYKL